MLLCGGQARLAEWKEFQQLAASPSSLIADLIRFNVNELTDAQVNLIKKTVEPITPNAMKTRSVAGTALLVWL